ncbi:hypothetical protein ACIQMY_25120 [Streptomyces sp. NPDC091368]|uniref:hypothetical protein n=1 Tax=Streptomyces sp. NPDC091368 TaxID=3365993 RepID=UPI0037F80C9D
MPAYKFAAGPCQGGSGPKGPRVTRPWVRRNIGESRLWMWMPYRQGNRWWIKDALGDLIRPSWNPDQKRWEIAQTHLRPLIEALAERFGEVDVYLQFSQREICNNMCVNANRDDCTCSCMGENHKGAAYWKSWVHIGNDVLVGSERRERHFLVRHPA